MANDITYVLNGNNTIKTRITANGSLSLLTLITSQFGNEDKTATKLVLLRTGYSGNHIFQTEIASNGTVFSLMPTFSVSSDGYINIVGTGGNVSVRFIGTSRLN